MLMPESAHPEPAASVRDSLRAWLASLGPAERAALRELLAVEKDPAPPPGTATIAHEGGAPLTHDDVSNGSPVVPPTRKPAPGPVHEQETLALTAAPADAAGGPVPEVPGYEILREIGRGGMGVVYEARHLRLNRPVALKMILAGTAAGEQELERFRSEAELLAQFQHAHIVQLFEVGECTIGAGTICPYMALEYCPGGSLATALDGRPWEAREAARLVELLARTIHAAHVAGIIHRDLKPANVLLAPEGSLGDAGAAIEDGRSRLAGWTPKITDFGLAKRLGEGLDRTRTGAILGTPEYMAPEQAAGKPRTIGLLVDVYALGVILYELLTGRPPLRADSPLDTLLLVMEQEPPPLRAVNPSVPRDLETIALKCLQKDPARRYPSALELADDLRRHLEGEPIRARPPGPIERANRLLRRRPGLTIAWTAFAVALLLYGKLHGFFLPLHFGMSGITPNEFQYAVLPTAAVVMLLLMVVDLRFVTGAGCLLALVGTVLWFVAPGWRPEVDPAGLFLRQLAWVGLLAALAGFLPRHRWRLLLLFVPALLLSGGSAWLVEQRETAFLAGIVHGLMLGLLARLIAWSLNRDGATCLLGVALGACLGIQLAEWYATALRSYLSESGLAARQMPWYSLYLEICLAFVAAVVCGLTAGRRPTPLAQTPR
jgi:serine/threonine protein kinase